VTKAVAAIMTRIQSLCNFDGTENQVTMLIATASNQDNLCRMDPTWYPWL